MAVSPLIMRNTTDKLLRSGRNQLTMPLVMKLPFVTLFQITVQYWVEGLVQYKHATISINILLRTFQKYSGKLISLIWLQFEKLCQLA